jgi:hypothetical protein
MALDRELLILVLENLDAQAISSLDKRLIRASGAAGQHVHAGSLPLRDSLRRVPHGEADVIDHAADGPTVRRCSARRLVQIDEHSRNRTI